MKKSTYYNEKSESEADLTDRLKYVCVLMCSKCIFEAKKRKKTQKSKMDLETLENKCLYIKKNTSRKHQRTVKSKKIASIEATEALGFPELDLDEYELEDDNSGTDSDPEVNQCFLPKRCIKKNYVFFCAF